MATTTRKPQDRKPSAKDPIEVKASRGTIAVKLIGTQYRVKPPKGITSLRFGQKIQEAGEDDPIALLEALEGWVEAAFGDANAKKVLARLEDPKDDLDIPHLMELMEAINKRVSGNPST